VVGVGGGPAGLAAAWQAAQDGAAVQLFEALETVGGSAIWSDAITATPTAADLARWEATAGGPNPALRRYADRVVPDVIEALGACGVEFETTMNPLNDGLALVRPIKGGRGLVADLDRCTRSAGAAITTGAKVTGLSAAPEGGFVVQVGEVEHRADAVILATGGFMADLDHVRAVLKLGADAPLLRGAPDHADGNGILLGTALGGVEERPGAVLLYAHGTPAPGDPELALMVVDPRRGLIVTTEGEALPLLQGMRGDLGKDLAALPGGAAWLVVDALAFDRMPFFDYRRGGKIPPVALRSLGVEAPTAPSVAELYHVNTALQPNSPLGGWPPEHISADEEAAMAGAGRRFSTATQRRLPPPGPLPLSLGEALAQRRTRRRFAPGPLDLSTLATLLGASAGLTGEETLPSGALRPLRAAPSAGGLYPVEL
jgi:hypothetical protein